MTQISIEDYNGDLNAFNKTYRGGETAEFNLLTVQYVARVCIVPLLWHDGSLVRVYQQIKRTWLI